MRGTLEKVLFSIHSAINLTRGVQMQSYVDGNFQFLLRTGNIAAADTRIAAAILVAYSYLIGPYLVGPNLGAGGRCAHY